MSHALDFDVRNLVLATWMYRGEEYDKPLTAQDNAALAAIRAAIKALRDNKDNNHTMDVVTVHCRAEVARRLTGYRNPSGLTCRDDAGDRLLVWRHEAGLLLFLLYLKQTSGEMYAIARKILLPMLKNAAPQWPSRREVEVSEEVCEEVHDCQECGSGKRGISLCGDTWLCDRCAEYCDYEYE
jgi:hypothetical protein